LVIAQRRTTVGSFVYDAFGRRMNRTISGTTTQFLYDGLNPVQELNGSNGVVANLLTGLRIDEYFARNGWLLKLKNGALYGFPANGTTPAASALLSINRPLW
jgi:hypothetical protein